MSISAQSLCNILTSIEVDGSYAPDFRRLVLEHRQPLTIALRSGDGAHISSCVEDAVELLELWGLSPRGKPLCDVCGLAEIDTDELQVADDDKGGLVRRGERMPMCSGCAGIAREYPLEVPL